MVIFCDTAIIFQCFTSCGLGIVGNKRNIADLQSLGSGEKGHVYRIIIKRIDQRSFFDHKVIDVMFLGFQCTGNSYRSAANDDERIMFFQDFLWFMVFCFLTTMSLYV